jgi:microcystin-dependent protein
MTHTFGATAQKKPRVPAGELVVGTVLPYTTTVDAGHLAQQGWLYCDGRALSRETYADLFAVIGTLHGGGDNVRTFNLPDYRGWLLRGVDDGAGRDPDAAERTAAAPGGQTGDACGTEQGYATALPVQPYTLTQDGTHTHEVAHVPNDNSGYTTTGDTQAKWNSGSAPTEETGYHRHDVTGGDPESRPINAYVTYVIKFRG